MKTLFLRVKVSLVIVSFLVMATAFVPGQVSYVSAEPDVSAAGHQVDVTSATPDPVPVDVVPSASNTDEAPTPIPELPINPTPLTPSNAGETLTPTPEFPISPAPSASDTGDTVIPVFEFPVSAAPVVPTTGNTLPDVEAEGPTSCLFGDSLGDSESETILPNDEPSIGSVLVGEGYSASMNTSQVGYQTFNTPPGSVTLRVKLLASYTSQSNVFGYFINKDISTFKPIFRSGNLPGYEEVAEFVPGKETTITVPTGTSIGFAINAETTAPASERQTYEIITTMNSLNSDGADHVVSYHLPGQNYVLGFEAIMPPYPSDQDFNDLVVRVEVASCQSNTPPTIALVGSNPMEVIIGDVFNDPGATATDLEDGPLSPTHTGTVDVNTLGSYVMTYSVTDSGGLFASTNRTVNVVARERTDTGNGGNGSGDHNRSNGGGGGGGSGQVLGASTGPGNCLYLKDFMYIGWNNDSTEVLKLQSFLSLHGFEVPFTGVYDDATLNAVSRFQRGNFGAILEPWGLDGPTGFTYLLTKKKINEMFCGKEFPLTALEQSEIAGFRMSQLAIR